MKAAFLGGRGKWEADLYRMFLRKNNRSKPIVIYHLQFYMYVYLSIYSHTLPETDTATWEDSFSSAKSLEIGGLVQGQSLD